MKLLISLLLLYPTMTWSVQRPIMIRHYHPEEAGKIVEILTRDYHIPEDFIAMEVTPNPCDRRKENVSWHLCVDASGDLFEVHADMAFIKQTIRIFL